MKKLIKDNKFVAYGVGAGAAMGAYVSSINFATGALQLATYPLYMGYCAVAPVLRMASPLWVMPACTALGTLGGIVAQGGIEAQESLDADTKQVIDGLSAEVESQEYRISDLEEKVA